MSKPTTKQLIAAKGVLKYLAGTEDTGSPTDRRRQTWWVTVMPTTLET